jgi:hypothetical protein
VFSHHFQRDYLPSLMSFTKIDRSIPSLMSVGGWRFDDERCHGGIEKPAVRNDGNRGYSYELFMYLRIHNVTFSARARIGCDSEQFV